MEKLSISERQERAEHFKRLWTEYGFDKSIDDLKTRYMDEWQKSDAHENKKRDDLWRAVQVVDHIKQHVIAIISDGTAAKIELKGKAK